ncbi:zinc finger, CCHC-type containing protein [Tanacetum coccineum]
MYATAMKHMASNFAKLDKFEGVDFKRWQKKMHFLLSSMSVVYVLTTPIPDDGADATVDQNRKRAKWDIDDYVCRGLILIEAKYMAEDASSKKFLGSNFINYKMTDSRLVLEQYNELLGILGRFTQHKMNMDESIQVSCVIDKLSSLWKDFKHTLKHLKEELTLVELGSHLRIEESLRVQDSEKPKSNNVVGLQLNIINNNIGPAFRSISKLNDSILWHARLGHVHFKRMQDMSKDGLIPTFDMDTKKVESRVLGVVVRLPDPKLKTLGERGIECIFVGYAEHSKAFKFYVIKPNDSVAINSIIKSRDAIFYENRFSSVPRPSQRSVVNGIEDSGGSVAPEKVTEEDDPKTFDEAMKSHDVAFWKEAINDELDSLMGNNTWVLADLPPCCKPLGFKWIFKRKLKVDGTIEKFKARLVIQGFKQKSGIDYFDTYGLVARISTIRLLIALASIHNLIIHQMDMKTTFLNADKYVYSKFDESGKGVIICLYVDDMLIFGIDQVQSHYIEKVLKKFNYFECTPVSTPMDTSEKLMPNNGQAVSQLEYSRVIGCLMYVMTCTRPDIAFAMGKLSRLTYTGYPLVLEGYTDASWISNTEDNSSTSAAGKEAEWLKNLLLKIPLWFKPIAPISIRYDSAHTLAKCYIPDVTIKS